MIGTDPKEIKTCYGWLWRCFSNNNYASCTWRYYQL